MDAELLQLAREAVAALQGPRWVDVWGLVLSTVGLGGIFWGLFQMQQAGRRRDKEIDNLGKSLEQQGKALGQAVKQQGEALGQLAQMVERQSQTLDRQDEVLAELLRRTA